MLVFDRKLEVRGGKLRDATVVARVSSDQNRVDACGPYEGGTYATVYENIERITVYELATGKKLASKTFSGGGLEDGCPDMIQTRDGIPEDLSGGDVSQSTIDDWLKSFR
jgi:hypothetical protein